MNYTANDTRLIAEASEYLLIADGFFHINDLEAKAETPEARHRLHNMAVSNYHRFED